MTSTSKDESEVCPGKETGQQRCYTPMIKYADPGSAV